MISMVFYLMLIAAAAGVACIWHEGRPLVLSDLHLKERMLDFMVQEIVLGGPPTPAECPYLKAGREEVERICSTH